MSSLLISYLRVFLREIKTCLNRLGVARRRQARTFRERRCVLKTFDNDIKRYRLDWPWPWCYLSIYGMSVCSLCRDQSYRHFMLLGLNRFLRPLGWFPHYQSRFCSNCCWIFSVTHIVSLRGHIRGHIIPFLWAPLPYLAYSLSCTTQNITTLSA